MFIAGSIRNLLHHNWLFLLSNLLEKRYMTIASSVFFLVSGFLGGFVYRAILKYFASKQSVRGRTKNIGTPDRLLRAAFGAGLLVLAFLFASPLLFVFAGFCFFEALFSWCGLYAALGKNTCPL